MYSGIVGAEPFDPDNPEHQRLAFQQFSADLSMAAVFFTSEENRERFPVRPWLPPVSINFFVRSDEWEDPAAEFASRAQRIVDAGGTQFTRTTVVGDVQHVAELPFGSGRVQYSVIWIERVSGADDSTDTATRSWSLIDLEIAGSSGPELPMQVVHP